MPNEQQKRIDELRELGGGKARADAVAADLEEKNLSYAAIDARTLALLLGLDPDDNADWGRSFYVRRVSMEDLDEDQPCAENIELLEGDIPKRRYAELKARAVAALKRGRADMRVRKEERMLLEEKLTKMENPGSSLIHISESIMTSSGDYIEFEGVVGDGGDVCEFYGPYEIARGEGVDLDDFVCIE